MTRVNLARLASALATAFQLRRRRPASLALRLLGMDALGTVRILTELVHLNWQQKDGPGLERPNEPVSDGELLIPVLDLAFASEET